MQVLSMEERECDGGVGVEAAAAVPEADTVYLLMRPHVPISRTSRVKWLLDRLHTVVAADEDLGSGSWAGGELKVASLLAAGSGVPRARLTPATRLRLLAGSYRMVFCLDMSPSQCTVDLQRGELLLDELYRCLERAVRGVSQSRACVPGTPPDVHVTVIAHTPFFMSPAQQVLVKGVCISRGVDELLACVRDQLRHLARRVAEATGALLDAPGDAPSAAIVSPDANFVNMLRYSMLALSLLPEHSLGNIVIVTDGVVALPDVNIMESLLMQLHYDGTAVSFVRVGSSFQPHVAAGYVPYEDVLSFLAGSTMGACLDAEQLAGQPDVALFHDAFLAWTFQERERRDTSSARWHAINRYFVGERGPALLTKRQAEGKINTSLLHMLSRRMREGYTIHRINYDKDVLCLELSLPWKNFVYLQYSLSAPWPSQQSVVHFQVNIAAPYEFLHDITCLMKKELKSSYRQAVVERFWYVLTTLGESDASIAQHLHSFQTSNNWWQLPESVKGGMPVFVMVNSNGEFTASDAACPKFGGAWQPLCQLDNSQWGRWFHTHKLSVIVRDDAGCGGRGGGALQCRRGAALLYGRLAEWATFVLIENHSYVRLVAGPRGAAERPAHFCIVRVTCRLPCAVVHLAFDSGAPGELRAATVAEVRALLAAHAQLAVLHKPLEKLLIRYERVPSDFGTVVFPDGTRAGSGAGTGGGAGAQPGAVQRALFTTLSRYLYHRRWVWAASLACRHALGRVAAALARTRLREGFTLAHSSQGVTNMVLELEMRSERCADTDTAADTAMSCVVQYVLFPPHCAPADGDARRQDLQLVTEVWIEPQYGRVVRSPPQRAYMDDQPYYRLADKIGYVDSKCINSLLTLEHLSLMCQTRSVKFEELRNDVCNETLDTPNHKPKRRKISSSKKIRGNLSGNLSQWKRANGYFGREQCMQSIALNNSAPPIEERIHHVPFHLNLNNILPISQQAELLFSMFMEDSKYTCDTERPNKMLMEIFHEQIHLLHDRELNIGKEDSKLFLELLYQRHSIGDCKNKKCPIIPFSKLSESFSVQEPMWRCFIKGVSSTHVMLTFIPASLKDLKMLNTNAQSSVQLNVNDNSTYEYHSADNESIILPIYIYDCPLAVIMNSFVNPNKSTHIQMRDIYEDYSYNLSSGDADAESVRFERSRSPDSESGCELKTCMRQHCRALVLVHVKCFVVALFRSLQLKCKVSSTDVQYAVDQCEESTKDIDITDYLHVMCSHMTCRWGADLQVQCSQAHREPLEALTQDKFTNIISMSFQPVPTHPDYYYCQPSVDPATGATTRDEDSDDEMSLEMAELDSSSGSERGGGRWGAAAGRADSRASTSSGDEARTDVTDAAGEELRPLFLHLTATVYCRGGTVLPSVPVKRLPTCVGRLVHAAAGAHVHQDPARVRVTLDMICLTLPLEVQAVTRQSAAVARCARNASFCSTVSPAPSDQGDSTDDDSAADCDGSVARTHHLSDMQLRAVATLKHDIEWLLRDEIATRLLDVEPVCSATLQTVINHIDESIDKFSCKKDMINLNFVYGTSHGMQKFLDEFKNIPLTMQDGSNYQLVENTGLYYLIKKADEPDAINEQEGQKSRDLYCQQSDVSSNCGTEDDIFTEKDDHQYDWLNVLEKKRPMLPNFWMILKIENEIVTIYFHCRFLELQTTKVDAYIRIHNKIIYSIKDLCKKVNQSLLLQSLHDTRNCDRLLEAEDDRQDMWHMDLQYSRLKSGEETGLAPGSSEGAEPQHTDASLKLVAGFFKCDVVWESQFSLHPRLKTGPAKSGLSRGIQALRTVLNKFSVSNRSNMFVYQDSHSNVFYLRLHESCSGGGGQADCLRPGDEMQVFRSPSIVSLPLGQHKSQLHSLDSSLVDVRPRVRSFGEKERDASLPLEDSIALRVHGITDAGLDVKRDLVQVLQNRLDDAVLEIISMMLARNAMCPLTPEDVHFLQRPFHPPEHIVRLSIPIHINSNKLQLAHFLQYLRNDLLQFLNVPKYTDSGNHNHFKDYSETNQNLKPLVDDMLFLYNQSQPTSGNRGIACIALTIVHNKLNKAESGNAAGASNSVAPTSNYLELFQDMTFQQIVYAQIFSNDIELQELPCMFLEFRIWKQGRVNLDALKFKLTSAVSQAVWDLVSEHHLLLAPLCVEEVESEAWPVVRGEEQAKAARPDSHVPKACMRYRLPGNSRIKRRVRLAAADPALRPAPQPALPADSSRWERGDAGTLHPVYASMLLKWFEFAIELGVPNVKKSHVKLKNRHSIVVCMRELQHILSNLVPDITLKAFQPDHVSKHVYIPYSQSRPTVKCLLVGRNFDQWKLCINTGAKAENDINKLLGSKFFESDHNKTTMHQRLLLGIVQSDELILYTYNWSKERVDKLMIQSNSLGMWMSARSSVLNSVVAQKMGLFQNQAVCRKSLASNNPYLLHIAESSEHLHKFPLGAKVAGGAGKQQAASQEQGVSWDACRDSFPYQRASGRPPDPVLAYVQELLELRARYRAQLDEKKKLHGMWQTRGAAHAPHATFLRKHSRIIHFCHTPLLFLPGWRLQSAATRGPVPHGSRTDDEPWHARLCARFVDEYRRYLQTLGFVPLDAKHAPCHVQKPMLGGIMVFAMQLREPFFTVKLHAVECCRLQQKVSRNSVNQFTLSFLDECDKIKSLMHLHSFTYDFHLRTIHSYVADNTGPKVCNDYHLTKFLDDFIKYYPKTPNFARNVVCAESLTIGDLITEGNQLYIYLLSNNKYYNMQVLSMRKEDSADAENEYVLVQVSSTPQVWYKDSQDQQQTDDFDVTLVISNQSQKWQPNDNTLYLKFYIVLTSRREIFPKCDVEKTLGKFRTVSSGPRSSIIEETKTENKSSSNDSKLCNLEAPPESWNKSMKCRDDVSAETTTSSVCEWETTTDESDEEGAESELAHPTVEIKQERVNYIGYYSSHEQLMQQLAVERAAAARRQIQHMVGQGSVHCRTHLLWNRLVSQHDMNQLSYGEFLELRGLARLESIAHMEPALQLLLDQPFSWYQGLAKLLLSKYGDQHRLYVSPDGNTQHLVVLHPRYSSTFMVTTVDLHTSRGEVYAASRQVLAAGPAHGAELGNSDRLDLINGFVNCIAAHIWSGMLAL